jgi:hypothetical protein
MSGSNKVFLGQGQDKFKTNSFRAQALSDCPIISDGIRIGTAGTTDAVEVPAGAIVHKVALWNTGTAITGATLSVGVSGVIDKFLGVVSDIAANDIVIGGLAGTVAADPVGGAYFASGGVIQLGVGSGGTDDSTVKVLVWYTGTNPDW